MKIWCSHTGAASTGFFVLERDSLPGLMVEKQEEQPEL